MKEIFKKNNRKWVIAIAVMVAIIIVLSVLLVLEAKGVFYAANEVSVTITPPKRADSEIHTAGDYQYALLEDGTVMIVVYTGNGEESIEIPGTLAGKQVSAIGEAAYGGLTVGNAKKITVSEGITYIGKNVFLGADKVTLYLPSTLKQVEKDAMYGCEEPVAIYFAGTREQWNEVKVGAGNKALSIVNCTG